MVSSFASSDWLDLVSWSASVPARTQAHAAASTEPFHPSLWMTWPLLADWDDDGRVECLVVDSGGHVLVFQGTKQVQQTWLPQPIAGLASDDTSEAGVQWALSLTDRSTEDDSRALPALLLASERSLARFEWKERCLVGTATWTVPARESVSETEESICRGFLPPQRREPLDINAADGLCSRLAKLRDQGSVELSRQAYWLLACPAPELLTSTARYLDGPRELESGIVECLASMKLKSPADGNPEAILVGTDQAQVFILKSRPRFDLIRAINLPAVPIKIVAIGTLDLEFTILIACRDGRVYQTCNDTADLVVAYDGNGILMDMALGGFESKQVGFLVYIAQHSNSILAFGSKKTRSLFTLVIPGSIQIMTSAYLQPRNARLLLVALMDRSIRIYHRDSCICTLSLQANATLLGWGPFDREPQTLILGNSAGHIQVKSLKRTSQLPELMPIESETVSSLQEIPLPMPVKTKLYLEQALREKHEAIAIFQTFQHDVMALRVRAAERHLQSLKTSTGNVTDNSGVQVSYLDLTAEIFGIGPKFRISIRVRNFGMEMTKSSLIVCRHDAKQWTIRPSVVMTSALVPDTQYEYYISMVPSTALPVPSGPSSILILLIDPSTPVPLKTFPLDVPAPVII